jgi:hypothetical protein
MNNRRPYIAETAVKPGCAVVQGSRDNMVKAPGSDGLGAVIGLYPFEANEEKAAGEPVGIVLYGVAKALLGGDAQAGMLAALKNDSSGTLVQLSASPGLNTTVGQFLEGGSAGDYVDVLIHVGIISV